MTPPTAGELPGVRVFDDLGLEIRIDFSLEDRLEDLGHRLACCAGLHPNQSLGELVIPAGPQVHGVGPVDAGRQAKAVENLLAVAAGRRADVAVLPELSMTVRRPAAGRGERRVTGARRVRSQPRLMFMTRR